MATDQYDDDLEVDEEIVEDDDLELEVLDDESEVDYDQDFDVDDADEGDGEEVVGEVGGDEDQAGDAETDEEDSADDEDDDVDLDDDEEEEDEETLEVLLGPDNDTAATTPRSRSDDSGDAPPGEGEFTCRSCFLVKRRAQLADAEAMICLDCA